MVAMPQNLLVIMSDEHNPKVTGYAGHPVVGTPALDGLAGKRLPFYSRLHAVADLRPGPREPCYGAPRAPSPRLGQRDRL